MTNLAQILVKHGYIENQLCVHLQQDAKLLIDNQKLKSNKLIAMHTC